MPPIVIKTFLPPRVLFEKRFATCFAISIGSASLPSPTSPQACSPNPGSMVTTPLLLSILRFSLIAFDANICWFIDGAISTDALVARITVDSKSSALP